MLWLFLFKSLVRRRSSANIDQLIYYTTPTNVHSVYFMFYIWKSIHYLIKFTLRNPIVNTTLCVKRYKKSPILSYTTYK